MSIISAHFDAVKSRLESSPMTANNVFDIARTNTTGLVKANYLILFGGPPDVLDDDRLSAPQLPDSDAEFLYTVRAVGTTPAAVRLWSDAGMTLLVGFTPVVAGRRCSRITLDDSDPIQQDGVLYYADTHYELKSSRA